MVPGLLLCFGLWSDAVMEQVNVRGVAVFKGFLDRAAQEAVVADIRRVVEAAPLCQPVTPSGRPMSVRMTSCGALGWVTDRSGYRYESRHPSGVVWPPIPASVLDIWATVSGVERGPESCLVNFYDADAKMGLHQDKDEADFDMPVVSVSLGDSARFRIGQTTRGGKTESFWLESGDVCVMGGAARLVYHGIDKIKPGSSTLLRQPGRINLTLRVVT